MKQVSRRLWLGTAAALLLTAGAASAQVVVSFGDSLSDTGNLFQAAGTPPPPYVAGRFTNGAVFTELLAGGFGSMQSAGVLTLAGRPVDLGASQNYAFGGARTDRAAALPPGIPAQIDLFLAQGGRFRQGDLVTLYGGANNIFQTIVATPGSVPTILAASRAAGADIGASASRLGALGAPTTAVLTLPDFGLIPRLNANALTAGLGSSASSAFNGALTQGVFAAAAANPASNFYLVDVNPLLRAAVADPARFGFTNVTQGCLAVPSCAAASPDAQNAFLFFDDVHPTARGHAFFAALVSDYLSAGDQAGQAQAFSETALADRLGAEGALPERARSLLAATDAIAQGADLAEPLAAPTAYGAAYATIEGSAFDRDGSAGRSGYDYRAGTLRLGADYRLSESLLLGGAASASLGEVDHSAFSFDTRSFSADLYGTLVRGPAFVTLSGGIAHFDFDDIERATRVPQIVNTGGDTNGFAASLGGEAGYRLALGEVSLTPTLSLTYVHFDVDGFEESGAGARIVYGDYARDVLYGSANLNLSREGSIAGRRALFTGRIGYEDALADWGDDAIVSRIAGSPSRPSVAAFDDLPGRGFVLGGGVDLDATQQLTLGARYSVGFSDDLGTSHVGSATLAYRF